MSDTATNPVPVTGPVLYNDGLWRLSDGTVVPDPADASAPPDPFLDVAPPTVIASAPLPPAVAPAPVAPAPVAPAPVAPAPVAPAAPPTAVSFLPPQTTPAVAAASSDIPDRPVGTALVPGQLVSFTDDSAYGDPTRAGIVLVAAVTETGVNTAIVAWFESTSHPIDTARLSVL